MTNTLIHGIIDALSGSVSKEVIVFLISMIPILEPVSYTHLTLPTTPYV